MQATTLSSILLINLVRIRWIAISGQFLTILLVFFYLKISIPVLPCLIIVFISAAINTFSYFTNKTNNYLLEKEAFYFLLFDTIQLGILLYLTGGIYNPFSFLLIAPIIISASYLSIKYSLGLLFLSMTSVVTISNYYVPIAWEENFVVSKFFTYGLIISLLISLIFIFVYVYLFFFFSRKISEALNEA